MANQKISNFTQVWNDGGTTFNGIKMNVTDSASAADSNLINMQVGGEAKGRLQKNGDYYLISNDGGAAAGPLLVLDRDSASPAASDVIGEVLFRGEDSAGNDEDYADIYAQINDPTSTSEDASLVFRTKVAGSMTTAFTISVTGVTFSQPIILPQAAAPAPTAEGDMRWDTDDNRIVVGDGSGQKVFRAVSAPTATTLSGATVDFTIPAGCVAIDIPLANVGWSSTASFSVQIGDSGGVETTGYLSTTEINGTRANNTGGFNLADSASSSTRVNGVIQLRAVASNVWAISGMVGFSNTAAMVNVGGSKSLDTEITTVRLLVTAGAFNNGTARPICF